MRTIIFVLFILAIGVFMFKLNGFELFSQVRDLSKEAADIRAQVDALAKENASLKAKIDYLSHPENLEKELRAKFNYKSPGEQLIILTPAQTTTTPSQ